MIPKEGMLVRARYGLSIPGILQDTIISEEELLFIIKVVERNDSMRLNMRDNSIPPNYDVMFLYGEERFVIPMCNSATYCQFADVFEVVRT